MTYPQPSSNQYATDQYGFFRLNATLSSPGDIYESEQGSLAFAIGPDSDIANAVAVYLDEFADTTTLMQQIAFSANRAVVGAIYARLDATYGPANRRGRIFLYCNDIYDPNFVPTGFNEETDQILRVDPVFDVMQYFQPIASLGPSRVDRRYYFQNFSLTSPGGTQYIMLPYYGRRYASLAFKNANQADSVDITVSGVNFALVDDADPNANNFHQVTQFVSPTLAPGGQAQVIVTSDGSYNADGRGMYDAIMISATVNEGDGTTMRITFSDTIGGP